MAVTAKELAAKLGLSESAVSLALNNKPGVSTATRKRVLEAAKEIGYDLSGRTRALKEKKGQLCFVIFKKSGAVVADTPFFALLSDGVGLCAKQEGYDFVIRYLYEDENIEEQLNMLDHSGFSGIILLATEMDAATMSRFSRLHVPMVVLDAYFETLVHDYVIINNVQGAFLAASFLIAKRRSQPGYLRSAYSIPNFEERADGFYKAIRAGGMSTAKSQVIRLAPSQEGAYADMKAFLEDGHELADSFFADNDHIAIGAMRALLEAGYRIPEDVAIIGFDDIPICSFSNPPLSTVQVPAQYMGETAVKRLVQMIDSRDKLPVKIEINTHLKKRRST